MVCTPSPNLGPTAEIAYLSKYLGKFDSGIAFTDSFYLAGLARLPFATVALVPELPARSEPQGIIFSDRRDLYARQRPLLHVVNGLGSFQALLPHGFQSEHHAGRKLAVIHDAPEAYSFYGTSVWNLENVRTKLFDPFDSFIFVSDECRKEWEALGATDGKTTYYLPNTCAEEKLIGQEYSRLPKGEVRRSLGFTEGIIHLVVVATIQERKGQLDAVEALAELPKELGVHLHLVGRATDEVYEAKLKRAIIERGLTRMVTLHGGKPKLEALRYIQAADALLLPSLSEAMPMVLFEAALLETPVFSTPVGGVTEVLSSETGVLFPPSSPSELAKSLKLHFDEPSELRRRAQKAKSLYEEAFSNAAFDAKLGGVMYEELSLATSTLRRTVGFPEGPLEVAHTYEGGAFVATVAKGQEDLSVEAKLALLDASRKGKLEEVRIECGCEQTLEELLPVARTLASLGFGISRISQSAASFSPSGGLLAPRDAIERFDSPIRREIGLDPFARRSKKASLSRRTSARAKAYLLANLPPVLLSRLSSVRKLYLRTRKGMPAPRQPGVVVFLNSPMQLMAFASLWGARYREDYRDSKLVACVYSTNGARDFSKKLAALCQRAGIFSEVVDFTPSYRLIGKRHLEAFLHPMVRRTLARATAKLDVDCVFFAGFLSARGQKFLIECFEGAALRLFEDGLGSYVPKRVVATAGPAIERIRSGDCAELRHVAALHSVDLLLDNIDVPPQYSVTIPGYGGPVVSRAAYGIDYARFAGLLGAVPRKFDPDHVIVVTQNFHEHLSSVGYDVDREREMNSRAIRSLLQSGARVVVRPHPRASRSVWDSEIDGHPGVEIWRSQPEIPIELLLDRAHLPKALVGTSSSCLFYLRSELPCCRYPSEFTEPLRSIATDEHRQMIEFAQRGLSPFSAIELRSP